MFEETTRDRKRWEREECAEKESLCAEGQTQVGASDKVWEKSLWRYWLTNLSYTNLFILTL